MKTNAIFKHSLSRLLALALLSFSVSGSGGEPEHVKSPAVQVVLVSAPMITPAAVAGWKAEGFKAVAVLLEEQGGDVVNAELLRPIREGGLELYYWVEVGRNLELARAHPRWMASLGMHKDWLKNFSNIPAPGKGEVAKAYPWVPIGYREAFEAQLQRVEQLVKRAPAEWRGLLLNDLQGGPSSCGCGNLRCRWAIDYQVPSTASPLEQEDVAAKFVREVRQRVAGKPVIPVWTTECEAYDLPASKRQGQAGTGQCGTVGCALTTCPKVFARQWSKLTENDGPVALLGLQTALERTQTEYGGGPTWASTVVEYVQETLLANGGKAVVPERLWVVVQGSGAGEEAAARKSALNAGVGGVVVARVKIEQGYEPRILSVD